MRYLMACIKMFFFALNCVWVIIPQSIVLFFTKGKPAYWIPFVWMNIWRIILGIKIVVKGKPCMDEQVLYMSNHLSYLDIPALASVLRSSFVAKSEVGQWPLAGFLASLQQTAYIQRKRSKIEKEKNALQERIDRGDSLIIFPEGTSSSGFSVEPFKSSLFILALGDRQEHLYVQPITIKLLEVDGKKPQNKEEQDVYAWPRDVDIEMHHHLWRFAKTSGAKLEITFHDPLPASAYNDRKILAKACYERVSNGLEITNDRVEAA